MSRRAAAASSKRVTWSRWGTSGWRSVERLSAGLAPGQLPQLRGCHCPARPWAERGRGGQCPGEDEPARSRRLQRHGLFAPHPEGERSRPVGLGLYPHRGPHRTRRLPGRTRRGHRLRPGTEKAHHRRRGTRPFPHQLRRRRSGGPRRHVLPRRHKGRQGRPRRPQGVSGRPALLTTSAYARAAVEYARAVQQRNQLLRRIRDGYSSERTLATWDRKVVELGKAVLAGRQAALPVLEEHFIDALRALYGPEKAAIRYGHSGTLEEYSEALREAHSADVERGTTSVGPHRDDFEVSLGGVNLTTFGSQGQQRIATLALKFASRDYVRGAVGEDPILLFDDVMSELDERRREYLAGYFLESTQAVISTTNLEYFDEEILRRTRIIRISG